MLPSLSDGLVVAVPTQIGPTTGLAGTVSGVGAVFACLVGVAATGVAVVLTATGATGLAGAGATTFGFVAVAVTGTVAAGLGAAAIVWALLEALTFAQV